MITKNVDLIKDLVQAKHGDYQGYVSIDQTDKNGVYQLCADNGIDLNEYFILSFGLSDGSPLGVGYHKNIRCTVLLLEKDKYGSSLHEITPNVRSLESVDVIEKKFSLKYTDLQKYIKCFSFLAVTHVGDHIKKLNIIEDQY
jgi:hypothetical protein